MKFIRTEDFLRELQLLAVNIPRQLEDHNEIKYRLRQAFEYYANHYHTYPKDINVQSILSNGKPSEFFKIIDTLEDKMISFAPNSYKKILYIKVISGDDTFKFLFTPDFNKRNAIELVRDYFELNGSIPFSIVVDHYFFRAENVSNYFENKRKIAKLEVWDSSSNSLQESVVIEGAK
jgi:hypothetical protein